MAIRDRYVRFFPKCMAQLHACLTPVELYAYLKVLMQYMQLEGGLPFDDRRLALLAGLNSKDWSQLRDKLVAHGLAGVIDGKWVDFDQQQNLQRQLEISRSQRTKALKRQAELRDGEWNLRVVAASCRNVPMDIEVAQGEPGRHVAGGDDDRLD